MQTFDAQFRRASSMTVTFPAGRERPWVLSLAGSTAASNAMGRCVTDLTQRAASARSPPRHPRRQSKVRPSRSARRRLRRPRRMQPVTRGAGSASQHPPRRTDRRWRGGRGRAVILGGTQQGGER